MRKIYVVLFSLLVSFLAFSNLSAQIEQKELNIYDFEIGYGGLIFESAEFKIWGDHLSPMTLDNASDFNFSCLYSGSLNKLNFVSMSDGTVNSSNNKGGVSSIHIETKSDDVTLYNIEVLGYANNGSPAYSNVNFLMGPNDIDNTAYYDQYHYAVSFDLGQGTVQSTIYNMQLKNASGPSVVCGGGNILTNVPIPDIIYTLLQADENGMPLPYPDKRKTLRNFKMTWEAAQYRAEPLIVGFKISYTGPIVTSISNEKSESLEFTQIDNRFIFTENVTVEVYNILGVCETRIVDATEVNLDNLSKGFHVLKVKSVSGNGNLTQKVILK